MKTFFRFLLLLILASLVLLFTQCGGKRGHVSNEGSFFVSTIRHEGCQYVLYHNEGIIHKPLCDNPAHDEEDNEFATPERLTSK